jgi:ParB-like chromosome segregation protein Spo0J
MEIRDRVRELRRVRAGDLRGAPWNWRRHGDEQRGAVIGSLEELGITDPLKVRELPDGSLELWDGHLRQDILAGVGPDTLVPVGVTDLSEAEAKKANLVHDPIAGMAEADPEKLDALIAEVEIDNRALASMLDELANVNGLESGEPEEEADTDPQLGGLEYRVIVKCADEQQQVALVARLEAEGFPCQPLMS